MSIIQRRGSVGSNVESEIVVIKNKSFKGRVLTVVFVITLILTVSLLLVAFLTPGISFSVYLALLITSGGVGATAIGILLGKIFLECVFFCKKDGIHKRSVVTPTVRSPSVSSDVVFELGISLHAWQKFEEESKKEIRNLLQVTEDLKNAKGSNFQFEDLLLSFLREIKMINQANWSTNKVSLQRAGQALIDAIQGAPEEKGTGLKVGAFSDTVTES